MTSDRCAGRGLVTKLIHVSDGTYQSFGYNKYGDELWDENELRQRTTYDVDQYGRVTAVKTPLPGGQLAITTSTYVPATPNSASNSPLSHTTNNPDSVTSPTGIKTTFTYDKNWRKSSITAGAQSTDPATTWSYYDNVGNQTYVIDPRGNDGVFSAYTTHTVYDALDRVESVTDPLVDTITNHYDSRGRLERITRPDGTEEIKTFDAMNRVRTDTVPQDASTSITTTFTYDPSGTIHTIKDGKDLITTFEYDASDMKTRMIYPNGTEDQTWTYDPNHNLIARKTVSGVSQLFNYDDRNRQISMAWSNGADWATFGYDMAGRMTNAINPVSTVTRDFDEGGRMKFDRQQLHVYPVSAVSRKAHGSAGIFDITLPIVGTAGVECRSGGATGDYTIAVTFPRDVVSVNGNVSPQAEVTSGTGAIGIGGNSNGGAVSISGKTVTIPLTNVSNQQTIVVTLHNVSDGTETNDSRVAMTVLLGDVKAMGSSMRATRRKSHR